MAVKAAADVITSLIGDATISQLSSLIPDLLQVLSFAISSYDAELAVSIFGLFDDTTTSSEPFLQPCLREVLDACCAVALLGAFFLGGEQCGDADDDPLRGMQLPLQSGRILLHGHPRDGGQRRRLLPRT